MVNKSKEIANMKINLFKSVLAASLAAATLASCQSEPEVGSTLYPTAEENYSAKAYLYTGSSDGNKLTLAGVKSSTAITLSGDSALFYVRLQLRRMLRLLWLLHLMVLQHAVVKR